MTTLWEGRYVKKEDLGNFGYLLGIGATPDSHWSKSRQQDLPNEGVAGNRNIPIPPTFRQWFTSYELESFGMPCPVKNLVGWVPRHFTTSSSNRVLPVCSPKFGSAIWPNTMHYKGSLGLGKQQIVRASKHRWPESPLFQTRRIGG